MKTLRIGEYYGSEKTVRMWARVQPYLTRLRSYVSGVSYNNPEKIMTHLALDLSFAVCLKFWLGSMKNAILLFRFPSLSLPQLSELD